MSEMRKPRRLRRPKPKSTPFTTLARIYGVDIISGTTGRRVKVALTTGPKA